MTIDVEDYFHTEAMSEAIKPEQWPSMPSHVQQSTERLLQLFEQNNVKATMFFLGWVADKYPALVAQAATAGHEIACHSYWHRAVFRLTPQEFREDLKRAKQAIEAAANQPIYGYRAPSFSMVPGTEWAADALAESGFTYDSSVNPIAHDFYSNADAPRTPYRLPQGLVEIPIATARVAGKNICVGGGAYFRIFPLRYTTWGLSQVNNEENRPAMFYLHPWEIDSEQPRLDVKMKSRLRQYTRLSSTYSKLEALVKTFKFTTTKEAFSQPLESVQ